MRHPRRRGRRYEDNLRRRSNSVAVITGIPASIWQSMLDIAKGRSALMKYAIAIAGISIAFSTIASDGASAEPVLMLNEPRDVAMAEWSCRWADDEIKADEHLIKSFTCSKSELCQRALDISVACR